MSSDPDLPEGWREVGCIRIVRAIDADGQRRTTTHYEGDVMWWEALGMLRVAQMDLEAERPDVPNT